MIHHLTQVGHPAGPALRGVDKQMLVMDWQTTTQCINSGVFLMRHMETYMGGGARGWYTGLTNEGQLQDKQVASLRKKYTAKMLLVENNKRKKFVDTDVKAFYELDEVSRAQITARAEETRKHRLHF